MTTTTVSPNVLAAHRCLSALIEGVENDEWCRGPQDIQGRVCIGMMAASAKHGVTFSQLAWNVMNAEAKARGFHSVISFNDSQYTTAVMMIAFLKDAKKRL